MSEWPGNKGKMTSHSNFRFDFSEISNYATNNTKSKHCTKIKIFIKYFFSKCDQNLSLLWMWSDLTVYLVKFNEEIVNAKLYFLCSEGKDILIKNENFL